jgi:hypothetical protein
MSAALDDVSNFRIWTGFLLEPPRTMPGRTILPVVLADFDRAWIGALLILGLIAAIGAVASRIRHQADNMEAFIAEFGRRTERYVEMAVNEPSRFESIFADKSERGAPST